MIGNVLYFNHPLERKPISMERSVEKEVLLVGWTHTHRQRCRSSKNIRHSGSSAVVVMIVQLTSLYLPGTLIYNTCVYVLMYIYLHEERFYKTVVRHQLKQEKNHFKFSKFLTTLFSRLTNVLIQKWFNHLKWRQTESSRRQETTEDIDVIGGARGCSIFSSEELRADGHQK